MFFLRQKRQTKNKKKQSTQSTWLDRNNLYKQSTTKQKQKQKKNEDFFHTYHPVLTFIILEAAILLFYRMDIQ